MLNYTYLDLVSGVQQGDLVIHIHTHTHMCIFKNSFPN